MNKLRSIREKKGLSLSQLSARASIPARILGEYEEGRQAIPIPHARILAKALWVKVEDLFPPAQPIAGLATPPPPTPHPTPPNLVAASDAQPSVAPRPGWGSPPKPPRPQGGKPPKSPKPPPEPIILPATEGQVTEILRQGHRAGLDEDAIAAEVGLPLTELNRSQAREWIRIMRERAATITGDTRRSESATRLPDDREPQYLAQQREAGAIFTFTMFDGQLFTGQIKDFTPYTIVVMGDDGNDVVLRKLGIAYYQKVGTGQPLAVLSAAAQDKPHADVALALHKGEVSPPQAPAAEAGLADDGEPGVYGSDEHATRQEEDSRRDDVADTPGEPPLPAAPKKGGKR